MGCVTIYLLIVVYTEVNMIWFRKNSWLLILTFLIIVSFNIVHLYHHNNEPNYKDDCQICINAQTIIQLDDLSIKLFFVNLTSSFLLFRLNRLWQCSYILMQEDCFFCEWAGFEPDTKFWRLQSYRWTTHPFVLIN